MFSEILHALSSGVAKAMMTIAIALIGVTLICLGKVGYNLYFHPLRKYPGFLLARASRWWYIYHLANGSLPFAIKAAHDKYGDVVRIAPNELGYTNPQAWHDIYGHRHGEAENSKDERDLIREGPEADIVSAGREQHSKLRRMLAHGFSDKALREQQPTVNSIIDLLIQKLQAIAAEGQCVDIRDWYNFTSFDIIGQLAYSESFECLSNSSYHPWVQMLTHYVRAAALIFSVNRIGVFKRFIWKTLIPRKYSGARVTHHELVHQKLLRRLETKPAFTDLLDKMIAAYRSGQISLADLSTNSRVLVVAGSETTASLLTGATYFLASNEKCMTRLTSEIRDAFPLESDINMEKVSKLPYFMAVLDEALRVFPPAASAFTRVTPPEGARICGEWIPGGTSVGITIYAMNYSEANWRDAASFRPERFLRSTDVSGESDAEALSRDGALEDKTEDWSGDRRDALQPFGYGPRNCIGRNLAYMEMRLIMARMLWNFDISLAPGNLVYNKQKIFVVWEKSPLMVHLKPVKREGGAD